MERADHVRGVLVGHPRRTAEGRRCASLIHSAFGKRPRPGAVRAVDSQGCWCSGAVVHAGADAERVQALAAPRRASPRVRRVVDEAGEEVERVPRRPARAAPASMQRQAAQLARVESPDRLPARPSAPRAGELVQADRRRQVGEVVLEAGLVGPRSARSPRRDSGCQASALMPCSARVLMRAARRRRRGRPPSRPRRWSCSW